MQPVVRRGIGTNCFEGSALGTHIAKSHHHPNAPLPIMAMTKLPRDLPMHDLQMPPLGHKKHA